MKGLLSTDLIYPAGVSVYIYWVKRSKRACIFSGLIDMRGKEGLSSTMRIVRGIYFEIHPLIVAYTVTVCLDPAECLIQELFSLLMLHPCESHHNIYLL